MVNERDVKMSGREGGLEGKADRDYILYEKRNFSVEGKDPFLTRYDCGDDLEYELRRVEVKGPEKNIEKKILGTDLGIGENDMDREELMKKVNIACPNCGGNAIKKGKCDVFCVDEMKLYPGSCGGEQ